MMMMMMITKGYGVRAKTIEDQKFHVTDGQNTRDQIRVMRFRVIKGPKARDQNAFCAFHSFLVEVQTNAGLHTCDACVITTWAELFIAGLR